MLLCEESKVEKMGCLPCKKGEIRGGKSLYCGRQSLNGLEPCLFFFMP